MDDQTPLIEESYRDRVRRARLALPEEKLRDGPRLFDYACKIAMWGIRSQHPEADDRRVRELLCERVSLQRRLEGQC
jgi:hypothetical protein